MTTEKRVHSSRQTEFARDVRIQSCRRSLRVVLLVATTTAEQSVVAAPLIETSTAPIQEFCPPFEAIPPRTLLTFSTF